MHEFVAYVCGLLSVQGRISKTGCMTLSPSDCLHSIYVSHKTYGEVEALTHWSCTSFFFLAQKVCARACACERERVCARAIAYTLPTCQLY